eukprot:1414279-Pyramimonas_sp.AAC.1
MEGITRPSTITTMPRLTRASPTSTLLGLSTKPRARLGLDRAVRKMARSASPPWLASTVETAG